MEFINKHFKLVVVFFFVTESSDQRFNVAVVFCFSFLLVYGSTESGFCSLNTLFINVSDVVEEKWELSFELLELVTFCAWLES